MPTQQIIPISSDPNVSFIYRIEVDGFKHYEPNIDYYTKYVYEARLLRKQSGNPNAEWEVLYRSHCNSMEACFIEVNHRKKKLTGEWR